jgi:threonine/homoserine/homoserine lactone efflux protein
MNDIWLFATALMVVYIIPGPDMILLLDTSFTQGRRKALAVTAGLGMARITHVFLAAAGLTSLLVTSPWAYDLVRYLGAGYLTFLGIRILFPKLAKPSVKNESVPSLHASQDYHKALYKGLLTNLLNPKALIFCSILLPQFIDPKGPDLTLQFLFLGVILVFMGLFFDSCYAILGASIKGKMTGHSFFSNVQRYLFASLLIALGARLIFESKH